MSSPGITSPRPSDRFSEDGLIGFLIGYQEVAELEMSEIWALKPALQSLILDRIITAPAAFWPVLVTSLRNIGEAPLEATVRSGERRGPRTRARSRGGVCSHGLRQPRGVP